MKSGEPTEDAVQVLMCEVSRLTAAEQRLRIENENLLEARREWEDLFEHYVELFDLAPVPSMTVDEGGFVREANAAAQRLLGPSLVASPLRGRVLPGDRRRVLDLLTTAARSPAGESVCEVTLNASSGEPFHARLSARRMKRGQAATFVVTMHDLRDSDRKVEEHRLLQETAEEARAATMARDRFIAMLSHELRTPLTPVLAAVSSALLRDEASPPLRKTLTMIARNIEAERRLIDDLLDTTRIAHGKLRVERAPVDVHVVVQEALSSMTAELARKGLSVSVELEAGRCWASADAGRLRQVFWNLLQNAVKFSSEGGQLGLRSWNREGMIAVEVSDTGEGITAETLSRIFSPFQQGLADRPTVPSRSGLGLGLAICRGIVDLHGGQVHATSAGPGRGARFVVDLVTIEAPPVQAEPRLPAPLAIVQPKKAEPRILLVEDDEDTAETLAELLRSEGFHISVATSIAAAMKQDVRQVDLVLSDIGLGDGSGLELMRRLRAKKDVPGIVLSGYGTEADVVASQAAGFSAHLVKPISIDKLVATIHRAHSGVAAGTA